MTHADKRLIANQIVYLTTILTKDSNPNTAATDIETLTNIINTLNEIICHYQP